MAEKLDSPALRATSLEQLFEFSEWPALLNSFDADSANTAAARVAKDPESDALWERLASTRWLDQSSDADEHGASTTLAPRPSA